MTNVAKIQSLYELHGQKPYGEDVSQLQHAVQVARLAEQKQSSESLIAACLLHDIGHLFYNDEIASWSLDDSHERIGASLLSGMFGESVAAPVRLHVMAKRYLCTVNEDYYDGLSEASRISLELQGGLLKDADQIKQFEQHVYFKEAVQLRIWDDEGKDIGVLDSDFAYFIPLLNDLQSY